MLRGPALLLLLVLAAGAVSGSSSELDETERAELERLRSENSRLRSLLPPELDEDDLLEEQDEGFWDDVGSVVNKVAKSKHVKKVVNTVKKSAPKNVKSAINAVGKVATGKISKTVQNAICSNLVKVIKKPVHKLSRSFCRKGFKHDCGSWVNPLFSGSGSASLAKCEFRGGCNHVLRRGSAQRHSGALSVEDLEAEEEEDVGKPYAYKPIGGRKMTAVHRGPNYSSRIFKKFDIICFGDLKRLIADAVNKEFVEGWGDALVAMFENTMEYMEVRGHKARSRSQGTEFRDRNLKHYDLWSRMINNGLFKDILKIYHRYDRAAVECLDNTVKGTTKYLRDLCRTQSFQGLWINMVGAIFGRAHQIGALTPEIFLNRLSANQRMSRESLLRIKTAANEYFDKTNDILFSAKQADINKKTHAVAYFSVAFLREMQLVLLDYGEWKLCEKRTGFDQADSDACKASDELTVPIDVYKKVTGRPAFPGRTEGKISLASAMKKKFVAFFNDYGAGLIEKTTAKVLRDQYRMMKHCTKKHLVDTGATFTDSSGAPDFFQCMRSMELGSNDVVARLYALTAGFPQQPGSPKNGGVLTEIEENPVDGGIGNLKNALKQMCNSGMESFYCQCLVCSVNSLGAELTSASLFTQQEREAAPFNFPPGKTCASVSPKCSIEIPAFKDITPYQDKVGRVTPLEGFTAMLKWEYARNQRGEGQTMSPFAWNFMVRRFAEFAGEDGKVGPSEWSIATQQLRALKEGETPADRRRLSQMDNAGSLS